MMSAPLGSCTNGGGGAMRVSRRIENGRFGSDRGDIVIIYSFFFFFKCSFFFVVFFMDGG